MRASENRFRLLFERAFDAIILTDENARIIDTNQSACGLTGFGRVEMIGRQVQSFLVDEDAPRLDVSIRKAKAEGNDFPGELVVVGKDGSSRQTEAVVAHFEFLDDHYLIMSLRDISERLAAEEALRAERELLYEKNVALKEILQHIEEEKTEIKKSIADKVEQVILPLVKKTMAAGEDGGSNYYAILAEELRKLSGFSGKLPSLFYRLTPREIEICSLIKTGATNKDIARILNISITTVAKHRERIRSRLDIAHKEVNLMSFLQNIE
jgi:PAS domain S-box-containing protein